MNLIDIYIQEVTRRLPEKSQEDIALELRSTIEDMLPDDYTEDDVKKVLTKLGSPAKLASGYQDRPMHLIGPRYFDVYVTLLKMIVPIAAVISLISVFPEYFWDYQGDEALLNVILDLLGLGIWRVFEVSVQTFFWFTLVFAIIERADKAKGDQPVTTSLKEWAPDDLKSITYVPKKKAISKFEVFGSLLWTAIWATLYFYADKLIGVYENGNNGLEFVIPALNQDVLDRFWLLVVLLIGIEIAVALYKLILGKWTKALAFSHTAMEIIGVIVFIILLTQPNFLNPDFVTYMTNDLFTMNPNQFNTWFIVTVIMIFIISAAISIYDGFRKSRIR